MADSQDPDVEMEDDYDEEADSDFDVASVKSGGSESSSDEADEVDNEATTRAKKRRKVDEPAPAPVAKIIELDSGDEATIKEHKKERRKQRKKGEDIDEEDGNESEGWRARTRAMRERDKEERKQNKLATIQGSTIDVDRLWEEMNRPISLHRPTAVLDEVEPSSQPATEALDKENAPLIEEMITIKRTYKFAGEMHTEEKTVPKSSAEAQLWLAQQSHKPTIQTVDADGRTLHRPLRKISRFDPNFSNLDAFKGLWTSSSTKSTTATGPKLNVVEKSKMDWAAHVDTAGLQEELSEAAKAKGSYLSRDDFLREVEYRREEEARAARLKGL